MHTYVNAYGGAGARDRSGCRGRSSWAARPRGAPPPARRPAPAAGGVRGGQGAAGSGAGVRATAAQQEGLEEVLTEMAPGKVGDIMFVPRDSNLCIALGDVLVVNPSSGTYCSAAAREDGSAAAVRDVQNHNAYHAYDPDAYNFVPLSHEMHGRSGPGTFDSAGRGCFSVWSSGPWCVCGECFAPVECGFVQRECLRVPYRASIFGRYCR